MKEKVLALLDRILRYFSWKSFLPQKLPIGATEHEVWAARIIAKSGLPDNRSTRFTLATMILHAPAEAGYIPDEFFVRSLIKAASNQVAHYVMNDLKTKQVEEEQAAKTEAEKPAAASDESK